MCDDNLVCPVCKKEGILKCSSCQLISYCSKEHQKDHWPSHKLKCRHFDIKSSKELGRYLVANKELSPDSLVISERPLVFGPKISGAKPQCLGCYQPVDPNNPKTLRCPRCKWPICGNQCLGIINKDHHLPECIVLCNNTAVAENNNLMYEAVFPLRCLLLQKRNNRKWQQLTSLESHVDKRQLDQDLNNDVDNIAKYLCDNFLDKLDTNSLPEMSRKIIHFICGVIETNSLEITAGQGEVYALYPSASLMEHSCVPNTKHFFQLDDYRIDVFTASHIAKGENLSTMYTHILWGTAARQDHLKSTKFFICHCKRCTDPTELGTDLSSLKCIWLDPQDVTMKCSGKILPCSTSEGSDWKCDSCPATLTSSHVSDLMSRLSVDIDELLEDPRVPKLEQFLSKLETILHTNHYHCFMVKHSLLQLYGRDPGYTYDKLTADQLEKKIKLCQQCMAILDVIDPSHGRVSLYSGVVLLELHSAFLEKSKRTADNKERYNLLIEAKRQLDICVQDLVREPPFSPGAAMLNVAKSNLIEVAFKIRQMKVIEL